MTGIPLATDDGGLPERPGASARRWIFRWAEDAAELCRLCADRARAVVLSLRGARIGRKVRIGPRCTFERPWCLTLAERVCVEEGVYIKVTSDDAAVRVGAYSFLGRRTELDVVREVRIGSHSHVAPGCFVTDHGHGFRQASRRIDEQGCEVEPVRIGDDVWLGAGTVVLMGTTIGDGAVVGAASVVRMEVPAFGVFAGAPARPVGRRE